MTIGAFLFLIIPHLGFQRVIRVTGFIEVENTRIFQRSVRGLDFVSNRVQMRCTVRSVSARKFVGNIENRTSKNTQIISPRQQRGNDKTRSP